MKSAAFVTAAGLAVGMLLAACGDAAPTATLSEATIKPPSKVTTSIMAAPVTTGEPPLAITQVTTSTTAPVRQLTVARGIDYSRLMQLDVYSPAELGPWPVAVVVHGMSQSRGHLAELSEAIAAEGVVVYNVQVGMSPPFFTPLGQIACAVRYARLTAVDHGGDPGRVTLVGNSSGAHLGVIVAMAGDDFAKDCVATEGPVAIDAFVGYEGPYNVATRVYGSVDLVRLKEDDPEVWKAVNTYSHVGGNPDLVVRLIHGRDDDRAWYDVLPDASVELHDALTEAGYDVGLTFVDGADHGALGAPSEAFEVTVTQVLEVARRPTVTTDEIRAVDPPEGSTIAVLGCSNTKQHARGYTEASEEDHLRFGPDLTSKTLRFWALPSDDAWSLYDRLEPDGGYTAAWFQICLFRSEHDGTMEQLHRERISSVVELIRARSGDIPIYLSPVNFYEQGHVCSLTGPDGVEVAAAIAEWGANNLDNVRRGPDTGPLSDNQLFVDGCHLSDLGELFVGEQLVDFFDP